MRLAFDINKKEAQAIERIAFWRKQLQRARLYNGRAKDRFSRICAALVAHRFQRRVQAVCVRMVGGDLPTRRPRAKDSNTDDVLRWRVERFHDTLKHGLKVERLQFDDARTLMNAVSAYSMVAWRLMVMTDYARLYASRPCSEIVSVEEHRALSAKAKGSVRSVGEAVLEIVKLGGYGRRHRSLGVKVIWRGLYALQFLTMGFSLALSRKNMRQG